MSDEPRTAPPTPDMFAGYDQERMPRRVYNDQGGYTFTSPTWHCDVHGDHKLIFTIFLPGVQGASYCLPCVLSALERLGLKPLPRVD